MKGYVIEAGYMGFVDGEYMLFANEDDYREYMNDLYPLRINWRHAF